MTIESTPPSQPNALIRTLLCALLFVAALASFSIGIDRIPTTDRDEARFSQSSRQMAVSGDWIDIRYQETTRYKKPIGIYWAQAGVLKLLGAGENSQVWMHRIPSLISAALAVVLLVWVAAPLVPPWVGLGAGAMLATTYLIHAEAHFAKTDAALLVAVLGAMGVLARAWMASVAPWQVFVFWTAIAAGLLLKGPIVLAPVVATAAWISVFTRDWRWILKLKPLIGAAWAFLLTAPWYIAITFVSDGAFWIESFGQDFAGKIVEGQENHGAPPGMYLVWFLMMLWPWTLLLPMAGVVAWRLRRDRAVLFLTGWIVPMYLVLELVPTKLPHYPLPFYPAILLLGALAVHRAMVSGWDSRWALLVGGVLWGIGMIWFGTLIIGAPIWLGDPVNVMAGIGLLVALALAIFAVRALWGKGDVLPAVAVVGLSALFAIWSFLGTALPSMDALWITRSIASETARHSCLDGRAHLVGYHEPSAVFELGQATELTDIGGAFEALADDPGAFAWITGEELEKSGRERPGDGTVSVNGLHYNSGDRLELFLFVAPGDPASPDVCEDGA